MSRRRRSATDALVGATLLGLLLCGCAEESTEIPAGAVSEASGIVGSGARDALALAPADVDRLATQAKVSPETLESVASSLDETDVWVHSMDGVQTIYDDPAEGVEITLVDVACRAVASGTVHTDYQLHYAIYPRVNGFSTSGVDRLTDATMDLFTVLHDAGGSDRAGERAAVVLTCHTLGALSG